MKQLKTTKPPPVMLGKHSTKAENNSTAARAKTSTNFSLSSRLNMAYRVENLVASLIELVRSPRLKGSDGPLASVYPSGRLNSTLKGASMNS